MFNIGDRVKRRNTFIPSNEPGALGLSRDTPYTIEWVSSKGLCVLKNYLMLVNDEYLEYETPKYAIFFEGEGYLAVDTEGTVYDPKLIHLYDNFTDAQEYAEALCNNKYNAKVIKIYGYHSLGEPDV